MKKLKIALAFLAALAALEAIHISFERTITKKDDNESVRYDAEINFSENDTPSDLPTDREILDYEEGYYSQSVSKA
jgi:hypothetical protein